VTQDRFAGVTWKWWTSNSWRRLTAHDSAGRYKQEGDVLCPVRSASDGHPDLSISPENMAAIEALPELYTALFAAGAALRSYQYGNASPELAQEVADFADAALAKADRRSI
jgi:hypothetical protein